MVLVLFFEGVNMFVCVLSEFASSGACVVKSSRTRFVLFVFVFLFMNDILCMGMWSLDMFFIIFKILMLVFL